MGQHLGQADALLFWYWIRERHSIYRKRQAGLPPPWSEDPILRQWKFTNVFRQLDRGTVWLTDNFVIPSLERHDPLDLLFFNIAWYRLFNWTGTGELLGFLHDFDPVKVIEILKRHRDQGHQIFTNAHKAYAERGREKIDSIVEAMVPLWENREWIMQRIAFYGTLEGAFGILGRYRAIGPFIGYEIVTDLRHTPILNRATDIMTWGNAGPGAQRGLERLGLYYRTQKHRGQFRDSLFAMRWLLEESRTVDLGTPALELRDIEHSLCEYDKWCRVKFGEGTPRMKYNGLAD